MQIFSVFFFVKKKVVSVWQGKRNLIIILWPVLLTSEPVKLFLGEKQIFLSKENVSKMALHLVLLPAAYTVLAARRALCKSGIPDNFSEPTVDSRCLACLHNKVGYPASIKAENKVVKLSAEILSIYLEHTVETE